MESGNEHLWVEIVVLLGVRLFAPSAARLLYPKEFFSFIIFISYPKEGGRTFSGNLECLDFHPC